MEVSEVLNKAADLLEKPGAWTQGEGARTPEGGGVRANDLRACSWDIIGAIHKAAPTDGLADSAKNYMLATIGNLTNYNDAPGRTQAEVVEALRQAARQSSPSSQEAGRG